MAVGCIGKKPVDDFFRCDFGCVFVCVRESEMFNTSRNRLDKVREGMCRRCVCFHAKLVRLCFAFNFIFQ